MTKFEFEKVMNHFGQTNKKYHAIYNLRLYHDEIQSVIVDGYVPLELAKLIHDKYNSRQFGIRITPFDYDEPQFDVHQYYIDKVEGLTAFLLELSHYVYAMESNDEKLEYSLNDIDERILKSVNTNLSEPMKKIANRKVQSYIDYRIKNKIKLFDEGINPYNNMDLKDIDNNFKVRGYNANHYSLIDKELNIELKTIRSSKGFVNKLIIHRDIPFESYCTHSYDDKGEMLSFYRYDFGGVASFELNLTTNTFTDELGNEREITEEDADYVIGVLDSCIFMMNKLKERNIHPKKKEPSFSKILK